MEYTGFDKDGYRWRLRLLRKVCGDRNQTDFADYIGVDLKRWHHYERGVPLSRDTLFQMYRKCPEICPYWIWFGDATMLTEETQTKIKAAERALRRGKTPPPMLPPPKRLKKR